MDITIELVLFVLFAALIATMVRLYDTPVSKAAVKPFVLTYLGSLITAVIVVWMLMAFGEFSIDFVPFATVAGTSVGGMAFVRSLIEGYRKATGTGESAG